MLRPLFRLVPDNTRIHFMRGRYMGLIVSAILSTASVVLFFHPGLHLGIDFAGGVVMEARTPATADIPAIRAALAARQVPEEGVQRFGSADQVLIRIRSQPSADSTQQAVTHVREALEAAQPGAKVLSTEAIGASVSAELFRNGLLALALSLLMIMVYIWFRFEWQFAVGAVVTLILDVTKAIGFLALTRFDFDLVMVAAILTILGYSTNDKVVVYRSGAGEPAQVQDHALARADRPVDQRDAEPHTRHLDDGVPGLLAAGAVRRTVDLGIRVGDAVRHRGGHLVVDLHRGTHPTVPGRAPPAPRRRPGGHPRAAGETGGADLRRAVKLPHHVPSGG